MRPSEPAPPIAKLGQVSIPPAQELFPQDLDPHRCVGGCFSAFPSKRYRIAGNLWPTTNPPDREVLLSPWDVFSLRPPTRPPFQSVQGLSSALWLHARREYEKHRPSPS